MAPLGATMTLPKVATASCAVGRGPRGVNRRREGEHRIATVDETGRPGVVGFAAERELPPPVWPDRRRHCQRSVHQIQGTALLDMQFDEYPDAIDQVRVLAEVLGITPDPGESLGERDSVDVT